MVHGIETDSMEVLCKILNEGLKPRNEQEKPRVGYTVVPEYVSLSMVGDWGYERTSTAYSFGASERRFNYSLTVVIDPEFVAANADRFMAVGQFFSEGGHMAEVFTENGEIMNGIKFGLPDGVQCGDVFPDEVVAKTIPPEAIVAVIARESYKDRIEQELREVLPERKIQVLTTRPK